MDHLKLLLRRIDKDTLIEIDGLNFSNCAYIDIEVNGKLLLDTEQLYGSFLYLEEFKKSVYSPGDFLIFTSVTGIADDAGWELIKVVHSSEYIIWKFDRDDIFFEYTFSKKNYKHELGEIEREISLTKLKLEPVHVIFPE